MPLDNVHRVLLISRSLLRGSSFRLLDLFEFAAHRRIVDTQMRGDLIEPIPVLVGLGYRFLPALREYPLQRRLGGSPLRPRDFLEPLFSGGMFLDERFATQVDLPFQLVPRPARQPFPDKFPVLLLRL